MAASSFKEIRKLTEDKLKLFLVLLQKFINERNPREKQMIIVVGILGIIFVDYWLLINPVVKVFTNDLSGATVLENDLRSLQDDQKNQKLIESNWNKAKEKLVESEKRFIASDEIPAFLENISKLAPQSGVRLISMQPPTEGPKKETAKETANNPYTPILIRLNAVGGTHEFGKFLSLLETNPTFIKVTDIRISPNPEDERKHILELSIEVYRKEAR